MTAVLAIGLDPAAADLSAFPGVTPELVRHYIDAEIVRLRSLGYEVETCLIGAGDRAIEPVEAALREGDFDCVLIGAGLRQPPERLGLFEAVLNLVHALAPGAKIAFNTTPADTAEAVQRWVDP
jgi:hypothetical protein